MGNSLALIFETFARILHESIDPMPERLFYLITGVALVAVGIRVRRTFENY